jgi:hypothetical protein
MGRADCRVVRNKQQRAVKIDIAGKILRDDILAIKFNAILIRCIIFYLSIRVGPFVGCYSMNIPGPGDIRSVNSSVIILKILPVSDM